MGVVETVEGLENRLAPKNMYIQISGAAQRTVDVIVNGVLDAIPKLVFAVMFLTAAYIGIKLVLAVLRSVLHRAYPDDQKLVANLFVWIAAAFMWFGAGLVLLNILGLGDIAASLGTASGFLALGVSYALSDRIADTVAGIYLLRDPDFQPGDLVETADTEGTVKSIELRKTRLDVDGDTVVLSNSEVEKRWRKTNPN